MGKTVASVQEDPDDAVILMIHASEVNWND